MNIYPAFCSIKMNLTAEMIKAADIYSDELFAVSGFTSIIAEYGRFACDNDGLCLNGLYIKVYYVAQRIGHRRRPLRDSHQFKKRG
jgi:hypothetical protein